MDDQSCIKALSQLQGLDQWIFSESADYCSVEAQLDTYQFAAVFVKQLLNFSFINAVQEIWVDIFLISVRQNTVRAHIDECLYTHLASIYKTSRCLIRCPACASGIDD